MVKVDLSIIIVNWNSQHHIKKCISSIKKNTPNIDYEIIVVDSGSFDGCGQMLKEFYPEVQFIQIQHNIGFGQANNEGFKNSKGEIVLFLNPDTEVEKKAIEELYSQIHKLKNAGVVGGKLLNSDRSLQLSCVQSFPNILNQILGLKIFQMRFAYSKLWGISALVESGNIPEEVEVISGACLMIKRSVFEKLGMFSSEFFMYFEDTDLCYKVRKAGYRNYYVPAAVVVHHGGTSSSKSTVNTFSSVMHLESMYRYFRKNRNQFYCYQYRFAMLAMSLIRLFILLPSSLLFKKDDQIKLSKKALLKWKARLRWSLGMEKWVQNY